MLEHSYNVKAHGVATLRYSFGYLKRLEIELVKIYELLAEYRRGKQSDWYIIEFNEDLRYQKQGVFTAGFDKLHEIVISYF